MTTVMASTQEQLKQYDEEVRRELGNVRSQLDQIEQQSRFEMQTSGYDQTQTSQMLIEVTTLKVEAEAFAQRIRDRADRLISQQQATSFGQSSPQVFSAVRQVLSLTERIWQHVQQALSGSQQPTSSTR